MPPLTETLPPAVLPPLPVDEKTLPLMLTAPEPETLPLKEAEAEVGVITVTTGLLLVKPKVLAEATEAAAMNREMRTMFFLTFRCWWVGISPDGFREQRVQRVKDRPDLFWQRVRRKWSSPSPPEKGQLCSL